jgi:hypothetical protein
MFSFTVLWRGVWARKPKKNVVMKKELANLKITKLFAIVALDKSNR